MKNIYVEITNICNLSCEFCPGHTRPKKVMTPEEFGLIAQKIRGRTENLFLHVMGEPLLHPRLHKMLEIADGVGAKLKLTTNGTLIKEKLPLLASCPALHTVSISLHSLGANGEDATEEKRMGKYLADCFDAASQLAFAGKYVVFRLWNIEEGMSQQDIRFNESILRKIEEYFSSADSPWVDTHRGKRIADHVFLEWGEKFEWPDLEKNSEDSDCGKDPRIRRKNCYALRAQIAVLADGTVVPCCLDRNGDIPLGNLLTEDLDHILNSARAVRMKAALENHKFIEPLCFTCGFKRK